MVLALAEFMVRVMFSNFFYSNTPEGYDTVSQEHGFPMAVTFQPRKHFRNYKWGNPFVI
jgi:hypothetical protein